MNCGSGGDEEMNGRYIAMPAPLSALSIVENPEEDMGTQEPPFLPWNHCLFYSPQALPQHLPSQIRSKTPDNMRCAR